MVDPMVSQQRLSSMRIAIAMCNRRENPIFLLQEVASAGGLDMALWDGAPVRDFCVRTWAALWKSREV